MTPEQRAAARQLVAELEAVADRLKVCDQRFVCSWRSYLTRTGEQARIGSLRLALLRRIHGCYYPAA
jgi:hypothetical protein